MDAIVFIHIPKTAGTSFRQGAEKIFDLGKVCCDYGPSSQATSKSVTQSIYAENDYCGFEKKFREKEQRLLSGHFNASKYAPLFGVEHMVTFFRDPTQRILSEYKHFRKHHGYMEDFKTFYNDPQFINRQIRMFKGIHWATLGFTGLTEQYAASLSLLNEKYGLDIPLLEINKNMASVGELHELDKEDEKEIYRLNALEIANYKQIRECFEQRKTMQKASQPFVRGMIVAIYPEMIAGWAMYDKDDRAVNIQVSINGDVVGVVKAAEYRPFLKQIGTRRYGYCGFSYKTGGLQFGDRIECSVVETGQPLGGTPRLITEADMQC